MMKRFLILMLLVAGQANAGFLVADPVKPQQQQASCVAGGVASVGTTAPVRPLISSATNEPVATSLRRIVPKDWSVNGAAEAEQLLVSWQGGKPWNVIVSDLAVESGLCLVLDYENKVISIVGRVAAEARSPEPPKPAPTELQQLVPDEPVSAPAQAAVLDQAPATIEEIALARVDDLAPLIEEEAPAPIAKVFEIRGGDTARSTLAKWCEAEGWTLEWRATYDYPIDAGYQFAPGTTFQEAVKTLLRTYWQRQQPLLGRMYNNHVLLISGR